MQHFIKTALLAAMLVAPGLAVAAGGHTDAGHSEASHGHSDMGQGPIREYRELTPQEATIQAVLDTYGRAMEQRSVEIMEQAVIPGDFSTIESGYPNWSWEDFRDNHLKIEMAAVSDVSYDIALILGEFQGSLGFAIFRYTAGGTVQGRKTGITGLGTAILEATDAGWRIHHLHTSAPRNQLEAMEQGTH
ncbi:MAG: nuclear transport factor 2 family protein [Gammaproteobacteria bacterium]|jgi:hypothetical protein|nr:nuclear transport factor 2 family protein [Gammaproteobacteria bacterium]